jgi:hypothetical protein
MIHRVAEEKGNPTGTCRLCQKEKELQDSHLMPTAF